MASKQLLGLGGILAGLASAAIVNPRQDSTVVTVDLSSDRGGPNHYASGVLLGIPDSEWSGMDDDQIPDRFYEDISFRYQRSGGSQLPQGAWVTGMDGYNARLRSAKSDYEKARSFGAPFILMPHDMWGTDSVTNATHWPGDNGNWDDYYKFLDQLLSDLKRLDMLDGMAWDVWNEPDVPLFWQRDNERWVELYIRTHNYIRERPEYDSMEITGPAMSFGPELDDDIWWRPWLAAISEHNIPPDQYSYHLLYARSEDQTFSDLRRTNTTLQTLLDEFNLPPRQVNVNEYARPEEQVPSTSAWYISRFERYDTFGLRANWAMQCQLHDFLANLLTKPGAPDDADCGARGYRPNGEWHVYAYYGSNMTGRRLATEGSADGLADAYATVDEDAVRVLFGSRNATGTWSVRLDNLDSLGFAKSGSVTVRTWGFVNEGTYGAVEGPEDRGLEEIEYCDGSVTIEIEVDDEDIETSFAFEFGGAGEGGKRGRKGNKYD